MIGLSPIAPFDPIPFGLLTIIVSLEAIFLSIFVLISQKHMTRQADRRAHLDLQVNLLAEQEMTTVLRMLRRMCKKIGVEPEPDNPEFRDLFEKTDLHQLMSELPKKLPGQA